MPDDKPPKIEFKKLPPPTQCVLWEQPDLVMTPRGRFETVETYTDESHLQRALVKCRECGQLYFYEFYERVDWDKGDDAHYSTFIPVPEPGEAARIKDLTIMSCCDIRRACNGPPHGKARHGGLDREVERARQPEMRCSRKTKCSRSCTAAWLPPASIRSIRKYRRSARW
jgi:hypothetical protein